MIWHRASFEPGCAHAVPDSLLQQLIADLAARDMPLSDYTKYGASYADTLGSNPKQIEQWAFDLGGTAYVHEPQERVDIDGLTVRIASDHVALVLSSLRKLEPRTFADGSKYFKAKFWLHATVLTPAQLDLAVNSIAVIAPSARARARAFDEARRRATAQGGVN